MRKTLCSNRMNLASSSVVIRNMKHTAVLVLAVVSLKAADAFWRNPFAVRMSIRNRHGVIIHILACLIPAAQRVRPDDAQELEERRRLQGVGQRVLVQELDRVDDGASHGMRRSPTATGNVCRSFRI